MSMLRYKLWLYIGINYQDGWHNYMGWIYIWIYLKYCELKFIKVILYKVFYNLQPWWFMTRPLGHRFYKILFISSLAILYIENMVYNYIYILLSSCQCINVFKWCKKFWILLIFCYCFITNEFGKIIFSLLIRNSYHYYYTIKYYTME